MDVTKHSDILKELKRSQDADHDMRENAREADLFTSKKDGQWERDWWDANDGKPRYTFDLTTPIVDQISEDIAALDFGIQVDPSGGDADTNTAETLSGLIRNIQNISNAKDIYDDAAESVVNSGIDGWRVVQKYVDDDCFDQDLIIEAIPSFKDRVWFSESCEKRDGSDSQLCFVMEGFTPEGYKERWPEGAEESVTTDQVNNPYFNKPNLIMVGEVYFYKETARDIVLMSNGKVLEDDKDFKAVADDLATFGVTETNRRSRPKKTIFTRKFDGNGWLEPEKETVFGILPVVRALANFKIIDGKVVYRGVVEKIMDPQRVANYSLSREVEEGALAPRDKFFMTPTQVAGHAKEFATMNTNSDPVQLFNHDPDLPGVPTRSGGAQVNPGLARISESAIGLIGKTANKFAASMGDNPNIQSGVAIRQLEKSSNVGNGKYFKALKIAINQTAKILIDAASTVYPPSRQVRILSEDGTAEMVTLGEEVFDQQTQRMVVLNDLSLGKYDSVCNVGPSFQSRQEETVASMVKLASVDPSIIQLGGDILLNNITAPGMSQMADRKRAQLYAQGLIPFDQQNEEERQQTQQAQQNAANQPPVEDPMMVAAQAEMTKAQNEQAEMQLDAQVKGANIQIAQSKEGRENAKFEQSIRNDQIDQMLKSQKLQDDKNASLAQEIKTQSESFAILIKALSEGGAQIPEAMQAAIEQASQIQDSQLDNQ